MKRIFEVSALAVLLVAALLADTARAEVRVEAPERVLLGQPFLLELDSPERFEDVRVGWLGKELAPPVDCGAGGAGDAGGCRALVLLGTDVGKDKPGGMEIALSWRAAGRREARTLTLRVEEKQYPEQRLKVAEKMATPPKQDEERLRRERAEVDAALSTLTPDRLWNLPFEQPLRAEVSSVYGLRRFFNDKPRSPHRGVDFAAGAGTPAKAVNDGRVLLVAEHYFSGKSVYVDHGMGVVSHYFHLSEISATSGSMVRRGDMLGKVGKTGRVTGAHLHFGLSVLARSVDPMPLFGEDYQLR